MVFRDGGLHLLGQVAGALWGVQDLIVEDGEVEGQAQADGVCGCQVHQSDVLQQVKLFCHLRLHATVGPGKADKTGTSTKLMEFTGRRVAGAWTRLMVHLSSLVSLQGVLRSLLAVGAGLELGQVTMVVALHLQVEHLALPRAGRGNQVLVKESQDAATYVAELIFNLQANMTLNP